MPNYAYDIQRPAGGIRLRTIDTVFATYRDPEEMRRSLISHDGYPGDIVVRLIENEKYVLTAWGDR